MNFCKFYIFVGYDDGVNIYRLWNPTTQKSSLAEICSWKIKRICSESHGYICLQTLENGIFMLYVDNMLVASQIMVEISRSKAHVGRTFHMKDRGEEKQILGIEVHRDGKYGKMWLLEHKVEEYILMRFNMKGVKLINISFSFHSNIASSLCQVYK